MNSAISRDAFRALLRFSAVLTLLYCFTVLMLASNDWLAGVEFDFYMSYARSIVADGDLNIINNIPPSSAWLVSSTFNYPEMHDHGASVLWAPFFWLSQLLGGPFSLDHNRSIPPEYLSTFVLTLSFGLLGMGVLSEWSRSLSGRKLPWEVTLPVLFGTGLYYYTFREYNGTEVLLFFYAVWVALHSSRLSEKSRMLDYFWLGVLFGFGRVIKIHFLSYLLIPAYFVMRSLPPRDWVRPLGWFALGFALLYLPLEYNNYLKYGFFYFGQGYLQEYSLPTTAKVGDILTTFFGPVGFFSQTPVALITFAGFFYLAVGWARKPKSLDLLDRMGVLFYTSILLKYVALMFVMTPGSIEYGARNFIIDTGAHCLILRSLFRATEKNSRWRLLLASALATAAVWAFLQHFSYIRLERIIPDRRFAQSSIAWGDAKSEFLAQLSRVLSAARHLPGSLGANLRHLPLLIPAAILLTWFRAISRAMMQPKSAAFGACLVLTLYLGVTFSNAERNVPNAETLISSGTFQNVVIGNGPHIFNFDNVATDLIPTIEADKHRRDRRAFDKRVSFLRAYLEAASREVLSDPVGFKTAVSSGRMPRIGVTGDDTADAALDFDGPDRLREL